MGIAGYALYVEYRKKDADQTFQFIYTPPFLSDTGEYLAPMQYGREINKESQRSHWGQRPAPAKDTAWTPQIDGDGKFIIEHTADQPFEFAVNAISVHLPAMEVMNLKSWVMMKTPVLVDMSDDELQELINGKRMSASFLRRMMRARGAAGFPKGMIDSEHPGEYQAAKLSATKPGKKVGVTSEMQKLMATDLGKSVETVRSNHKDFPEALIGLITQHVYPPFNQYTDEYRNPESSVSSREQKAEAEEVEDEVEPTAPKPKFYLRPNGEKYYPRKWGTLQDVEVLQKAATGNHYPLMYGPPGTGKTALAEAAFGEALHTIIGSGDTEVADLIGAYAPSIDPQTGESTFIWNDGPLILAAERGEKLLIDEIGLIDPKVLSIVYGFMDGRREYNVTANPEKGVVKAADGFFVVAATNPNAPGVNLSEALLSRFSIHVEIGTDWSLARGRNIKVPGDIVDVAMHLSTQMEKGEIGWAPQFRELLAFRDLAAAFDEEFAIRNLIASAPETDRMEVANALKKTFGKQYTGARV